MKTSFESLMEEVIPEINFLTVAGTHIKPGTVLESLEKEIVIGYLPNSLHENGIAIKQKFELVEDVYDIREEEVEGMLSDEAALQFMNIVGLKYKKNQNYRIDFDIAEIKSIAFKNNLSKIFFEFALKKLKNKNRNLFKRYKGHILVLEVLYADSFKVSVEVEKNGKLSTSVDIDDVDVEVGVKREIKGEAIYVSSNSKVPFGAICFKIKGNKLKEVD